MVVEPEKEPSVRIAVSEEEFAEALQDIVGRCRWVRAGRRCRDVSFVGFPDLLTSPRGHSRKMFGDVKDSDKCLKKICR
jgi:hypothetical protein